jgi:hypothetical protein
LSVFPQQEVAPADSVISLTDSIKPPSADTISKPRNIFESPINYKSADSMAVSLEDSSQIVFLYGDANIKYGTIELTAGMISVNLGTKEIYAVGITDSTGNVVGKPHFKEGTEEFDCTSLRYNFETSKGFVENVITAQQGGTVHGAKAKMVSKDVFCLEDGKFTACDAEHPHFYLNITKGKIINNKAVIAGRSYIVLEDFPIYFPFLPYGYIPTNKKTKYTSGILTPKLRFQQSDNRGSSIENIGFYWAASDYFDVKLTGEIYTKGSWGVGIATKYKLKYKFSGNFSFDYKKTITGEKGINQTSKPHLSVQWSHSQDPKSNPTITFSSSVNFQTSGYSQLHEYDNPDRYLSSTTSSSVSFSKKFTDTPFNLSMRMAITQNTKDATLAISLPEMTLNMKTIQPFKRKKKVGSKGFFDDFQIAYTANIRNSITTKEDKLLTTPFSAWKKSVNHSLPITLPQFKLLNYINITPSINYNEQWYFDYIEKYWVDGYSVKSRETGAEEWINGHVETVRKDGFKRNYEYSAGINGSTTIYGMYQMKNTDALISAIRHKIDLTLGMSYHPDFTNPKKGFNDWVQVDSLGNMQLYNFFSSSSSRESGSINFSMNNNLEMKMKNLNDSTSKEKFKKVPIFDNLSFAGSYNLAADSMNLSVIGLNLRTKIAGTVLNITGSLDPYSLDSRGRRTRHYMWETSTGLAKLGRITNLSTGFGFNISSEQFEKKRKEKEKKSENKENVEQPASSENLRYNKFTMPWRVNFNYSIGYTNTTGTPKINQTLGFSGNIDITEKWKATFNSGFDFDAMKMAHTSMTVTRNLHCWSMSFNFAPISKVPYYTFTIKANSSLLDFIPPIERRSNRNIY